MSGYCDPSPLPLDPRSFTIATYALCGFANFGSVAIQIGSEPTGMSGYFQSSNSAINKITPHPPAMLWSQFMAWINQRV